MIVVVVLVVVLLGLLVWRSRRRRVLAGRVAGRPVYQIEPPGRHLGNRKCERL